MQGNELSPSSTVLSSNTEMNEGQPETKADLLIKGKMSLIDHLQEFRIRIVLSLMAIVIGASISWFYAGDMIDFLIKPVGKLVFLTPSEAFFSYLKISLFAGFLLALPVTMHQIWSFLVPALHKNEKKTILILGPASICLFFAGVSFSYYLVLPAAMNFFMGFTTDQLQPLFSLGAYISFIIAFLLPFGIVFELPLFLIVLAKMGIINSKYLIIKRKIFIVLAFIIGALAAPTPDVFSQVMVAVPLLLLYELSIFVIRYVLKL